MLAKINLSVDFHHEKNRAVFLFDKKKTKRLFRSVHQVDKKA